MTQQTVDTLALQPPTSAEPRALQQWALNFVVQTRRLLEQVGQLQTVVSDIQTGGTAAVDEEAVAAIAAQSAAEVAAELQAQLQQTNSALTDAIGQLGVDLAALGLTVDEIEALTPQQVFEISLATRTSEVLGGAGEAVENAFDWAQRAAEAALQSRVRGFELGANIRTIQTASIEADQALAQEVATITASVGQVAADITTETTARVAADTALSQQISTVSSSVAGNTSAVTQLQQSVDGIESRWGVSISQNGHVQGLIQLDGGATGSNFVVVVDRFLVAKPDGTGSTPIFAVGTINGVGNSVGINGSVLVDGTIFARHIAAGSITADRLSVTSLAAIAANLGTITAGKIQDHATTPTYEFDVANGLIRRIDNTMRIDLKTKDFRIEV